MRRLSKIIYHTFFISLILMGCNNLDSNSKIDLESFDFNSGIDSLLLSGKYSYLDSSSISSSSSSLYYTFDVDTFRYGKVAFSGQYTKEFYKRKPEQIDDVFDVDEAVNRLDIYTSSVFSVNAIALIINNKKEGDRLLAYLNKDIKDKYEVWNDKSGFRTYLLHKDTWEVDKKNLTTISFYIVKTDARVGNKSLLSLIQEFYD